MQGYQTNGSVNEETRLPASEDLLVSQLLERQIFRIDGAMRTHDFRTAMARQQTPKGHLLYLDGSRILEVPADEWRSKAPHQDTAFGARRLGWAPHPAGSDADTLLRDGLRHGSEPRDSPAPRAPSDEAHGVLLEHVKQVCISRRSFVAWSLAWPAFCWKIAAGIKTGGD